ncbi:FecR family protein [Jiulongibacter sp. NS-SX5]|uniref:FecR family protein n=1 Tax=Jiulongibacter sp. NS-SX5 TaxID=3463854 RepID=UPI00405973B6
MNPIEYKKFLQEYQRGQYTNEAHDQFLKYFKSCSDLEKEEILFYYNSLPIQESNKSFDQLINKIEAKLDLIELETQTHTRRFTIQRNWVAAAAVLLVGVFGYFFIQNTTLDGFEFISSKKDIPIEATTTLQLADGSQYKLTNEGIASLNMEKGISLSQNESGIYQLVGNQNQELTFQTPRSKELQIILPDGSLVKLNAESQLHFPSQFDQNKRIVELEGEAYFEVAKLVRNKKRVPFLVHSNTQIIEVLGTHFNVSSYAGEQLTKTTLLEGKVAVRSASKSPEESIILSPGQQSVLNRASEEISIRNINIEKEVSWKDGYFNFEDTELIEIMRQLSRWYDFETIYVNNASNERFTGEIPKSMPLKTVIKLLEEGGDVSFEIEEKQIRVRSLQGV